MNVVAAGGGDEVVVLARLELEHVRHRGERSERDREQPAQNGYERTIYEALIKSEKEETFEKLIFPTI